MSEQLAHSSGITTKLVASWNAKDILQVEQVSHLGLVVESLS